MRRGFLLLVAFLVAGWLVLPAQTRPLHFAVVLEDPPVAERMTAMGKSVRHAAADDYRRQLQKAQEGIINELRRRKIPVTGSVQTVLNAVFVVVPKDRVAELSGLSGVRRVAWLPPVKPNLDKAAPLVGAPSAWNSLGGIQNAGKGLRIGLIDTGIDQGHPAFQDPSLSPPAGFPKCASPGDCAYTSNKVIVARSYVSMVAAGYTSPPDNITDPAQTSRPDDYSPRDRVGHGTATAMIAAGNTNSGPAATITGIAPKAYLGNYKVFGSPGVLDFTSGDAIIKALDDAVIDGMDIVSLSLGGAALYGPLDTGAACSDPPDPTVICDIRAQVVQNAVASGVVVVVAAGNSGDSGSTVPTLNTIGTPGTAPDAVTVGAITNSHVFFQSLDIPGGDVPQNLQKIAALFGDGQQPADNQPYPLRDVTKTGNDGLACAALPPGSLSGMLALVQRGNCDFSVKVNNCSVAGAVGVVIYRTDSDIPFPPGGLSGTNIPALMIGSTDGQNLKNFLASHADRPAVLDPSPFAVDNVPNFVVDFSSRGPAIGTFGIKPEIVTPGTGIYTATQRYDPNSGMYDASGYGAFDGTSFSAPIGAGAAALVWQNKPSLAPKQVKSALVNTASPADLFDNQGTPPVTAVGAGKLSIPDALRSTVSADPTTLSFGPVGATSLPLSLALQITNTGTSAASLALAVNQRTPDTRTQVSLSNTSVNLSPGQSANLTVRLAGLQPSPGTYEGAISILGGGSPLSVPYYYVVGDGVARNIMALYGDGFTGEVGEEIPGSPLIIAKVLDQYGVPVQGAPITFQATQGGGTIDNADPATDRYGIAAAIPRLGPQAGSQQFTATVSALTAQFNGTAYLRPTINSGGVVNAGVFTAGQSRLAPGCYASIYGQALAPLLSVFGTPYLPVSLAGVSVSFDVETGTTPILSLPGHIHIVSPNQINVQIPWELEGYSSVKMKVTYNEVSSAVYDLPLSRNAPAFFFYLDGATVPALDENYNPITPSNPVARNAIAQLYANGLGPVTNRPPSGEITPAAPFAVVQDNVTVTVGGQPASVEFKGLAPYLVGVYQLNVRIPAGIGTGPQPVVMTVNGVTAKTMNIYVK